VPVAGLSGLPYSLRVLAENLLRHGQDVSPLTGRGQVVPFHPTRILLQDSSGLPVLADLVALRDAVRQAGGDPAAVTPTLPMDLVVDHAVEADHWGSGDAAAANLEREYERHADRYRFLAWAQHHLPGLTVIPPGVGICHQLNLEELATVVTTRGSVACFDTLLGTDSHTTMVNALSVLGWGVGGIEATSAALGEPVWLPVPEVVGVRLTGALPDGVLATDLALHLTAVLREHGVVRRFVEFCGPGMATLPVPDRATVSNMAPEYGATTSFFPADERTLAYLRETGRPAEHVAFVEAYLRAQGMLWSPEAEEPDYAEVVEFDLGSVRPTVAGPSRPSQRLGFPDVPATTPARTGASGLDHGDVVLAAITSCTNTSNPRALVTAGLLARAALDRGLRVPPHVKTTFAPGSASVARLLENAGLQPALDKLGFHVGGYGCMTCMGNSGPLDPAVEAEVSARDLAVAAVLSGNRNFEGRVHPSCRLAYLASPPLVVAYALAGRMDVVLTEEPLGEDVYLADVWPSTDDVERALSSGSGGGADTGAARKRWLAAFPPDAGEEVFPWDGEAGFLRRPPFLDGDLAAPAATGDVLGARPLLVLGDGVTTDHISPVARIAAGSPAGRWLSERGVPAREHASFSARRLNHDVMLRGGFANPRLRNLAVPGSTGGVARLLPDDVVVPVHEAAQTYRERGVPVVVVAGHGYGAGSARDWAAKVTRMLGVRAVLARSFERIHRTNLLAMGVLPLLLPDEADLDGTETLDLLDLDAAAEPGGRCRLVVAWPPGASRAPVTDTRSAGRVEFQLASAVLTPAETGWVRAGGLLPGILGRAGFRDSLDL
jgi:aconitate hydratase